MARFPSILKTASLIAVLATTSAAQSTVEFSLDEGRVIAQRALMAGDTELARDFALALLDADPDDRSALIVLSAAQTQLGNPTEGRRAGRRAYELSTTRAQRYEAARLTALAAANEDRYTLSQLWLRRAAANAPSDADLNQTRRDFQGIRRIDPWSARAQLSFSPSNNVNGGSEVSYNLIDGLPFVGILSGDAQALPGVSASADLTFGRRISSSPTHLTTLTGRVNLRRVWLNAEGQAIAPTASNSDFGSTYVDLTLDHRFPLWEGNAGLSASLGGSWSGGAFSYPFARVGLTYGQALGEQGQITGRLSFEQQFDAEDGLPTDSIISASTAYRLRNAAGGIWSFELTWDNTRSDNLNIANQTTTLQASYQLAEPVGPAVLTFSLGASYADYPRYAGLGFLPGGGIGLVSVGREDEKLFGSIEAAFQDWDYAGFAPVVTISGYDTDSNVTRFQRNSLSLNIGIRSTF